MKATSASRFGAFVIDAIIVLFVSGLIVGFLPTTKKYEAAAEKQSELIDKILSTEVELDKAYDEIYEIRYELDKESIHITLVTIIIYLAYYGTFAYYKNGQTLGKKLMRIKVEAENDSNMTFILRTAFIHGGFTALISVVGVLFLDKSAYAGLYAICSLVNFAILLISAIFCMVREDGKGLHDLLFKTSVIKE